MSLLLEVTNLAVHFADHSVLSGVDLQIKKGEVVSIVGKSGSGKTVLLKTIAGLLNKTSGKLVFNFTNTESKSIGFTFQKSPLFPWLSLIDNLDLCTSNDSEKNRVRDLLKKFELESFKNYFPKELSGGMLQKVNLLRVLAKQSELVLMDEPFASLDSLQRTELQQFTYETCMSAQRSILLTTHDINEAVFLSDRIFILSLKNKKFSKQIQVQLKKPKILSEMLADPGYYSLYQEITQGLIEAERPL